MSTSRIPILTSVVVVMVLLNIAKIDVAATDECNNNDDCLRWYSTLKYCCRGKVEYYGSRVCGADCIGNKCISIIDCAPGECCDTNGKCRPNFFTPEVSGAGANKCKNNSDCRSQNYGSTLKYCCRGITSYSGSRSCGAEPKAKPTQVIQLQVILVIYLIQRQSKIRLFIARTLKTRGKTSRLSRHKARHRLTASAH